MIRWELQSRQEEKAEATSKRLGFPFRRLVGSWLLDLAKRCYSRSTLQGYEHYLRNFGLFLADGRKTFRMVTSPTVLEWIEREHTRGLKQATIYCEVAILRSFFSWLKRCGHVARDPMTAIGRFRRKALLPETLEPRELDQLLTGARGPNERALVELLYSTGARISELALLDVEDISIKTRTIRYRSRTSNQCLMPLNPRVVATMEHYLIQREQILGSQDKIEEKALFIAPRGSRARPQTLQILLRRIGREAGLGKRITGTILRNTFASEMLSRGADLQVVQAFLGHRELLSTERYSQVAFSPLKQVYERSHPRA